MTLSLTSRRQLDKLLFAIAFDISSYKMVISRLNSFKSNPLIAEVTFDVQYMSFALFNPTSYKYRGILVIEFGIFLFPRYGSAI